MDEKTQAARVELDDEQVAELDLDEAAGERGRTTVSVALGEAGGGVLNRRLGNRRVIRLSTVALNEGGSAITIRGVRVQGDGAGLTRTFRGEAGIYPLELAPGETGNMPLALTSCGGGPPLSRRAPARDPHVWG